MNFKREANVVRKDILSRRATRAGDGCGNRDKQVIATQD